ncbi:manganese efflux pump MntP family protein [Metallumcola ferriviriculae]|uniref:Putative manganese efflux pump MntP n=1 Tax=Metallumcola ferriviriculae TaxID=3039180 RepID=A0AAU0UKY1_9FIRM|nr:manganese efflux pump MntP family protein [Desulfitibacteraceae bacterium MK1]
MDYVTLMAVSVALGTDAFSMALGLGTTGVRLRRIVEISLVVSVFHVFMPLIGLVVGAFLGRVVGNIATVIGALVVMFIGLQMLWGSIKPQLARYGFAAKANIERERNTQVVTGFWAMAMLAASVSMDALSVGFSLGTFKANLVTTVLVMGIVAGIMTASGFLSGRQLGSWFGDKAQALGGIVLVAIGIKLLLS